MLESILRGFLGIAVLLFLTFLFSSNKKKVDWTRVGMGVVLQFALALMILKVPFIKAIFAGVVDFFAMMIASTEESAVFLFGDLAKPGNPYGFAFFVLPTIVFFSALSSLLYYLGILQIIVKGFAWVMRRTLRLTGAESLAAAANVFIGQTEAPLVVKPYLEGMTRSEIMCLMVGGMATIAGGVFGAYMGILGGDDPEAVRVFGMHLLTASIISAPAGIICAKILQPEVDDSNIKHEVEIPRKEAGSNVLDALASGTTDGLKLAVNVGAMLLAFMAFVFLGNMLLSAFGNMIGLNEIIAGKTGGRYDALTLQYIFGLVFSPLAWIIGVEAKDILMVGQILGEKTILNEFYAYVSLGQLKESGLISERSIIIATYALCGFANFASIGIQIGGIGAIAPGQRRTLSSLGLKSLVGGTVACFMTAIVAGMIVV
ncbi:MAG: Na+ dependent nucleoside transporter [Bacteroidetes bacterium]|nr:Na+ dependent nucleoside transporter [Bacteroidota bacterium]